MKKKKETATQVEYKCPHCKKIVKRDLEGERPKMWKKSFCTSTGKNARIHLLK